MLYALYAFFTKCKNSRFHMCITFRMVIKIFLDICDSKNITQSMKRKFQFSYLKLLERSRLKLCARYGSKHSSFFGYYKSEKNNERQRLLFSAQYYHRIEK